jgi:hypothetical protein
MQAARAVLLLMGLLSTANCDEYDYGGEGGGGGGGDDDYPPPPPAEQLQELLTVADFEAFLDNNDASVVATFTTKEMPDPAAVKPDEWDEEDDGVWEAPVIENPALSSYTSLTSGLYNYRFAYSTAPDVLAKMKAKGTAMFLYRSPRFVSKEHGDRPRERFPSDKFTESTVTNWLQSKAQPLVGQYSHSTRDRYPAPVLIIFMNLDFDKNTRSVTYVLKRARKAAVALKGKLSVAVAALSDMNYELGDYGLSSKSEASDILMGIKSGGDHYGATDTAFSGNSLSKFAEDFLAGKLEAFVKPDEPAPAEDDNDDEMPDMEDKEEM